MLSANSATEPMAVATANSIQKYPKLSTPTRLMARLSFVSSTMVVGSLIAGSRWAAQHQARWSGVGSVHHKGDRPTAFDLSVFQALKLDHRTA